MDPDPSPRRSRSKYSLAIWLFAIWNGVAWIGAANAFIGGSHAPRDPGEYWLTVLGLPAVGVLGMTCLLFSVARDSRRLRESAA